MSRVTILVFIFGDEAEGGGESVVAGFFRGVVMLLKAAGVAIALTALFLAGKAVTPRARANRRLSGARYLTPGVKVARARLGVHWYAWPGWQRTVVRLTMVALGVLEAWAPIVTSIGAGIAVGGAAAVALGQRVTRRRREQAAIGPRKVSAEVSIP
jgi:hypothetical protein